MYAFSPCSAVQLLGCETLLPSPLHECMLQAGHHSVAFIASQEQTSPHRPECSSLQVSREGHSAEALAQQAGIACPCIAKPQAACGVPEAHVMSIIFTGPGFEALSQHAGPMVLQQWVPHGAFLHKVYVIGSKVLLLGEPCWNLLATLRTVGSRAHMDEKHRSVGVCAACPHSEEAPMVCCLQVLSPLSSCLCLPMTACSILVYTWTSCQMKLLGCRWLRSARPRFCCQTPQVCQAIMPTPSPSMPCMLCLTGCNLGLSVVRE